MNNEEKPKLKVGDRVRVLRAVLDTHAIGTVREIVSIDSSGFYLEGCEYPWLSRTDLELVSEYKAPTPKFQVGDRVRSTYWNTQGEVGTIVGRDGDCWIGDGFSSGVEVSGGYSYCEMFLELVEPAPPAVGRSSEALDTAGNPLQVGKRYHITQIGGTGILGVGKWVGTFLGFTGDYPLFSYSPFLHKDGGEGEGTFSADFATFEPVERSLSEIRVSSQTRSMPYITPADLVYWNRGIADWSREIARTAAQDYTNTITKKENTMSLVKAIKAKLSPTDRTLVKNGYLTNNGERTSRYENELDEVIWQKLRDAEDTAEFRKELAKGLKEE